MPLLVSSGKLYEGTPSTAVDSQIIQIAGTKRKTLIITDACTAKLLLASNEAGPWVPHATLGNLTVPSGGQSYFFEEQAHFAKVNVHGSSPIVVNLESETLP
jgi:hypothetical protein